MAQTLGPPTWATGSWAVNAWADLSWDVNEAAPGDATGAASLGRPPVLSMLFRLRTKL